MWQNITTDQDKTEFIEIMKQMDVHYTTWTIASYQDLENTHGIFGYIYRDKQARIGIIFQPLATSKRFRIYTAGYTGIASPAEAAAITIPHISSVMKTNNVGAVLACVRLVDNEPLNEAISIGMSHPSIRARQLATNGQFTMFEVTSASCTKSCSWEWTGASWVQLTNDCRGECGCPTPTVPGDYLGQVLVITCQSASA